MPRTPLLALLFAAPFAAAADPKPAFTPAETLLKSVKAPPEFDVAIFATAEQANYPVFVAAAPDGTLFVSSDGNGSLDRKPGRGRVVRLRDTNGDGRANEVKEFAKVDSPRGLVWDHDRLYLMHPPHLSAFLDTNGDGVADEQKLLVKGLAFDLKQRPADHTTNGVTLGIDGWLYVAVGDFGFLEAEGTDGRKLQLRGGGVVRVRPDGTGLHLWSRGTRNILDVAVSPLLDGFARDNTNDGGGWDVRLHHFTGLSEHGYPSLYKHFADEIIQPLADYGGGSGCGACYLDEPGLPAKYRNMPATADWGREAIFTHPLTPNGATFQAGQEQFLKLPRATDLDIDANSVIYASSWRGGKFTYDGPDIGFIARVSPKGYTPPKRLDTATATEAELVAELESPSHRRRLAAQRALLRRGVTNAGVAALGKLAGDEAKSLPPRVAALFTLKLARDSWTANTSTHLQPDSPLVPWWVRMLSDDAEPKALGYAMLMRSENPLTRREMMTATGRFESAADEIVVERIDDVDPVIAHLAIQALTRRASSALCLKVVDDATAPLGRRAGALRVLQAIHTPEVVSALLERLASEKDDARRRGILVALMRLHFVEGKWKGDGWGTRPDTRGPYYQPETWSESERILAALRAEFEAAAGDSASFLAVQLTRHRIPLRGALERTIALAGTDRSVVPTLVEQLAADDDVPPAALPVLRGALAKDQSEATKRKAVAALLKFGTLEALFAAFDGLPAIGKPRAEGNSGYDQVLEQILLAPALERHAAAFAELADKGDERSEFAEAVLLSFASRKGVSPEVRAAAVASLDRGWADPKRRARIARGMLIGRAFADPARVAALAAALNDADAEVAQAAGAYFAGTATDPAQLAGAPAGPKVGELPVPDVLERVAKLKGDARRGEALFAQLNCVACHTVRQDQPQLGPYLGSIAKTYRRRELAEAILLPSKTIAQGFATNVITLLDGRTVTGFVTREAADEVRLRDGNAKEWIIPTADIDARKKTDVSAMPDGQAAALTIGDFASLVAYLESLSADGK